MDTLSFLLAPFIASLILTGIHAYLGVHVVERGVVFVDLALAQIAALGTTIAALYGFEPHGTGSYWTSLAFTFFGAAVFSTVRAQRARIPQEAVIGISYAVASAAAILAMSKSVAQTEHLKEMLVGNILTVSWYEVGITAVVYGLIGLFHYIFRKKFLLISMDPEKAEKQGLSVRFWDFLFYASFGLFFFFFFFRNAVLGSRRMARRAGIYEASSATRERSTATPANVIGSVALTPKRRLDKRRVMTKDAAMPMATPRTASRAPSPTIRRSTSLRCAPSAMRMPISWVRRVTEKATTP